MSSKAFSWALLWAIIVLFGIAGVFDVMSKADNIALSLNPIPLISGIAFSLRWGLGLSSWCAGVSATVIALLPSLFVFRYVYRIFNKKH